MKPLTQLLVSTALSCTTMSALAHDGHGLFGSHWHATDTLGFIGAAAALALAVWFTRGGK